MVAGGGGVNHNSIGIGIGLRTAVLISGSGTNLQAIIDQILASGLDINLAQVLSDRPDAFGLTRAREAGRGDNGWRPARTGVTETGFVRERGPDV